MLSFRETWAPRGLLGGAALLRCVRSGALSPEFTSFWETEGRAGKGGREGGKKKAKEKGEKEERNTKIPLLFMPIETAFGS